MTIDDRLRRAADALNEAIARRLAAKDQPQPSGAPTQVQNAADSPQQSANAENQTPMQPPWRFRGEPLALEWVAEGWHLRFVQPYRETKVYRCPGCQQEIFPRTLHVVVWPEGEPSQRRHWHKACWERHFADELKRAARRGHPAT
jgi:hypothetical protein